MHRIDDFRNLSVSPFLSFFFSDFSWNIENHTEKPQFENVFEETLFFAMIGFLNTTCMEHEKLTVKLYAIHNQIDM